MTAVDPELLAAYAVDALEGEERVELTVLLAGDPDARAEVDEYRSLLSTLTPNVPRAGEIPDSLWARIRVDGSGTTENIADVVPLAPPPAATPEVDDPSRPAPLLIAVAAVVALLVGVAFGALLAAARAEDPGLVAAAEAAFADPDATITALATEQGEPVAQVAVLPDGRAYLDAEQLAPANLGRAYQVWQLGGGDPIALGLLGRDELATFRLGGDAVGIAISDEPSTGSVQPTGPIIAAAEID